MTWRSTGYPWVALACGMAMAGCAQPALFTRSQPEVPLVHTAEPAKPTFLSKLSGGVPSTPAPAKPKTLARGSREESQLAMARLQERRGQTREAEAVYRAMISKFPDHPLAWHRLGVMSAKAGKYAEAEEYLQRSRQAAPANAALLSDLGYLYCLQHRLNDAERVLREAIAIEPHHVAANNNLGLVLGEMGRFEESMTAFKRVGTESQALANLAYVHSQLGNLAEAQSLYSRALSIDDTLRPAAEAMIQIAQRQQMIRAQMAAHAARQEAAAVAASAANQAPPPQQATVPESAQRSERFAEVAITEGRSSQQHPGRDLPAPAAAKAVTPLPALSPPAIAELPNRSGPSHYEAPSEIVLPLDRAPKLARPDADGDEAILPWGLAGKVAAAVEQPRPLPAVVESASSRRQDRSPPSAVAESKVVASTAPTPVALPSTPVANVPVFSGSSRRTASTPSSQVAEKPAPAPKSTTDAAAPRPAVERVAQDAVSAPAASASVEQDAAAAAMQNSAAQALANSAGGDDIRRGSLQVGDVTAPHLAAPVTVRPAWLPESMVSAPDPLAASAFKLPTEIVEHQAIARAASLEKEQHQGGSADRLSIAARLKQIQREAGLTATSTPNVTAQTIRFLGGADPAPAEPAIQAGIQDKQLLRMLPAIEQQQAAETQAAAPPASAIDQNVAAAQQPPMSSQPAASAASKPVSSRRTWTAAESVRPAAAHPAALVPTMTIPMSAPEVNPAPPAQQPPMARFKTVHAGGATVAPNREIFREVSSGVSPGADR